MNVLVFSIPGHPDWRWRLVDDDSKTVEDSSASFPTVAEALTEGRERRQRHVRLPLPVSEPHPGLSSGARPRDWTKVR